MLKRWWYALLGGLLLLPGGCSLLTAPYRITKGAVKGTLWTVKTTYKVTAGTTVAIYKLGEFSYQVVKAPLAWALTRDIDTIDGLPPKEAIRLGRVKTAPYMVKGQRYCPMSLEAAKHYTETGTASWYGYETSSQKEGCMTANGEAFDPEGLSAAHKYLPLPYYVKVTNLENGRSIVVRVNDRGPFPSIHNARSGERIIDLSLGAAKRLGFYQQGTARVQVEAIDIERL